MAVTGNVRTDLAKEIVIIKNRLKFVPKNLFAFVAKLVDAPLDKVQVSINRMSYQIFYVFLDVMGQCWNW